MLSRCCKLCYQVVDESIVKLRRFSSATKSKATIDESNDEEHEYQDENPPVQEDEPSKIQKKKVCIIKCKNPQFNFYEGQTYSKFKVIPMASRGWHHRKSNGDYFTIYPTDNFSTDDFDTSETYEDGNLHEGLIENLQNNNIFNPVQIQKLGIPKILDGHNVVLTAETGCGKTYAFLIPLLQQILNWKPRVTRGCNQPLGLILTPSKELTIQISKQAKKLSKNLGINIVTFVGGNTKRILRNPPIGEVDLVIASIGVFSKLVTNKLYKLDEVRHVVLDEADTLFDDSFKEKMHHFLTKIPFSSTREYDNDYPKVAQLTLCSATIPQDLPGTLNTIVDTNSIVHVGTGFQHKITVPQKFYRVIGSNKPMMLLKFIKPKMKTKTPIIIFSNNSATCDFTSIFLKQFNINVLTLHGNLPVKIRRNKFNEFQNGTYNVLSATDVGARGLDTTTVKDIINFEMPLISAEYVHRCGRIGRIGSRKDCRVINLISRPLEVVMTSKIEFAARKGKSIPMVDLLHSSENEEGEFLRPEELEKYEDLENSQNSQIHESANEYLEDFGK